MDLHRLVYVSQSRLPGAPGVVEAGIRGILRVSRPRNAAAGITGALVFSEGTFGQVLEGPIDIIERLFAEIERDPRHSAVTLLDMRPIGERSFAAWSMAYVGTRRACSLRFADIAMTTGFSESVLAGVRLHEVLVAMVRQRRRLHA